MLIHYLTLRLLAAVPPASISMEEALEVKQTHLCIHLF